MLLAYNQTIAYLNSVYGSISGRPECVVNQVGKPEIVYGSSYYSNTFAAWNDGTYFRLIPETAPSEFYSGYSGVV